MTKLVPLLLFGLLPLFTKLVKSIEDVGVEPVDLSFYGGTLFGKPVKFNSNVAVNSTLNPEELGSYVEGDILIPANHAAVIRNGVLTQSLRWPGGVVPYEIRGKFTAEELEVIRHAFNEYHAKTCVRFKPRNRETDYIAIINDETGCWSGIGRLGGRQEVNLQTPVCLRKYGTPMHELMHVLGFFHEQNRYERDAYVKVLYENVKPDMIVNFKKSKPKTEYGFGVEYDYASVMHYSPISFSRNGQPTLRALRNTPETRLMGQRSGFSKGDIRKINAMYKCK